MNKLLKKFAFSTVFAAAAGYIAGLLTAPKSGKETRHDIKDATVHTYSEAEKQLKQSQEQLSNLLSEAKSKANTVKEQAKDEFETATTRAAHAKDKVRELLSTNEDSPDDKDLKNAINEAQNAIKDLKKYLKK